MIANGAFLYLQRDQPESGGRPSIDRISFSEPSRLPDRTSGGCWLVHPGLLPCRARLDRPLVAVECRRVQGRRLPWFVYVQIGSHGLHHLIQ
jgi:hypothetical protein